MTKAAELAKMGEVLTNSQIGGRRNIIINGAMQVAQRATSATGLGSSGSTYNTVDRFKNVLNGTAGRFTQTQTADGPSGFANCLKIDVTTADTSIASGEYYILSHYLEGQDVQQIKKGTSDAEKVTVSFYVKGNASATYTLELEDADNNRRNSQTFAVTTSWNRVVLTFNADTTGTLDDDNARSFNVNFWLHAGSDFTGGTFSNNSWGTDANTRASSSQTSIFDSTDRTFFITGVQLEVGSVATPFEHRSFGEELALCQRYFQILDYNAGIRETGSGFEPSSGQVNICYQYHGGEMRANPTCSTPTITEGYRFLSGTAEDNRKNTIPLINQISKLSCQFVNNQDSVTGGDGARMILNNTDAKVNFDAEL